MVAGLLRPGVSWGLDLKLTMRLRGSSVLSSVTVRRMDEEWAGGAVGHPVVGLGRLSRGRTSGSGLVSGGLRGRKLLPSAGVWGA